MGKPMWGSIRPTAENRFDGGSEFTIEWHVEKAHNTLDWDLWVSTESNDGPWQEIAVDLAAGDTTQNAVHTFDWTLPNQDISSAWVRVRQDNAGDDYLDVSDASFSIAALLGGADFTGDGNVNAADLNAWQQGFGKIMGVPTDGDADLDRDVDGADFLAWQSGYDGAGVSLAAHSVPEPAATALLVLGMILMLLRWRWNYR